MRVVARVTSAIAAVSCAAVLAAPVAAAGPTPITYWRDGKSEAGVNFGSRTHFVEGKLAAPKAYLLIFGTDAQGRLQIAPGAPLVYDAGDGEPDYSDLWQIVQVRVPPDYRANSLRSVEDIEKSGYPTQPTNLYWNYPFAGQDQNLAGFGQPRQGWYEGRPVWYYNLGAATVSPGIIWQFTGSPPGTDPAPLVGQRPIVDDARTALRRVVWVQVPNDYVPNSINSAAGVVTSGFATTVTDTVLNVAPAPTVAPAPAQTKPSERTTADYAIIAVFALIFLATATYLLRLPAPAPTQPTRTERSGGAS